MGVFEMRRGDNGAGVGAGPKSQRAPARFEPGGHYLRPNSNAG
jgi:hypothetical protein